MKNSLILLIAFSIPEFLKKNLLILFINCVIYLIHKKIQEINKNEK